MAEAGEVEEALEVLFKAYDIDESGELSRREFLGLEMRLDFDEGLEFRSMAGLAKMTITDTDSSGTLEYDEFRVRYLSAYQEMNISSAEIVRRIKEQTEKALQERARMGPRYHAGIRAALRQLFALFDIDGNGVLTPEEWVGAQKAVATELSKDLEEGWLSEKAFHAADTNKDGVLDIHEFLEASFRVFEGVSTPTDDLLTMLQSMVKLMEKETLDGRKETPPITILVQSRESPPFQPPQEAWKDEVNLDDSIGEEDDGPTLWLERGELALPLSLATAEDVAALLRLFLKKAPDTWLSIYFLGSPKEGLRNVSLLRGERPGEGNVQAMLQYLCKPSADLRLFVKNVRLKPQKLLKQPRAFLEERDGLLAKRLGQCWGLDWETQLVGDGMQLPPRPLAISAGDALVVEVPVECGEPLDRYVCSVYMDDTSVLSKPVDESIVPKAKKPKKGAPAEKPNPLLQMNFVALKEGKCVLFVDVSWEDQEETLALERKLCRPVHENSIARIGPIEVEVQAPAAKPEAGTFVWWNGEKWSNKKGPAKKKRR